MTDTILGDRCYERTADEIGGSYVRESALMKPEHSIDDAGEQDVPVVSRIDRRNRHFARRDWPDGVFECAATISKQASALHSDPEPTVCVSREPEDADRFDRSCVRSRHQAERQPVEADQSSVGAYPEVTVAGLGDSADLFSRKPSVGTPSLVNVLRDRATRFHRVSRREAPAHEKRKARQHQTR